MLTRLRSRALITLTTAAALALVPPAGAHAALVDTSLCDGASLSQPFAPWGDANLYKLAPGGDAEGSLAGWTLSGGAKRVAGNAPFSDGAWSISIPAGGSVTTAASCVNAAYPSMRFFTRSSGGLLLGLLPTLKVDLVYRDSVLGLVALPAGVVTSASTWRPSPAMLTLSAVAGAVSDGTTPLAFRFTSVAGTWSVDDVFIDPHSRI